MSQIADWISTDEIAAAQTAIVFSLEVTVDSGVVPFEEAADLMSAWNALERIRCEITGDSPKNITGELLPTAG